MDLGLGCGLDVGEVVAVGQQVDALVGRPAQATGQFDCYNEGSPLLTPLNVPIGYTWEAECEGEIEF